MSSSMFRQALREKFRSHTRDEMCAALQAIGVQAQMLERGRPEEKITRGRRKSLGIIDIQDELIRWVDVKKGFTHDYEDGRDTYWDIEYGVPDSRLIACCHKVKIKTVRLKTIPVFGKVVDLKWEGEDLGLGLSERLNFDVLLNKLLMDTHDMEIGSYPEDSCWILTASPSTEKQPTPAPSVYLWECYQAIARHLLATPIPLSK